MKCLLCEKDGMEKAKYCLACFYKERPCALEACPEEADKLRSLCHPHELEFLGSGLELELWLVKREEKKKEES